MVKEEKNLYCSGAGAEAGRLEEDGAGDEAKQGTTTYCASQGVASASSLSKIFYILR